MLEKLPDLFSYLYTRIYASYRGIKIGHGCRIRRGAVVRRTGGGRIILGDRVHIHAGAMLLSHGGEIRIAGRCSINPYSILYGQGGLKIGSGVRIASHTVIIPSNHGIARNGQLIYEQPETKLGITIGDDVWIGTGVRILDGANINTGAVVAAGAVVRGELKSYGIYGGVPACLIKDREGSDSLN